MNNKRVAIVGHAASTREQAQVCLEDDTFDVWSINCASSLVPGQYTEEFFLDPLEHASQDQLEAMKAHKARILWTRDKCDFRDSVAFDFGRVMTDLDSRYFTSSVAWCIAFAVVQGYREIYVYGVDMSADTEWAYQRPCCEYWIGYARGRGIKVFVPDESVLFKTPWVYALEECPQHEGAITLADIEAEEAHYAKQARDHLLAHSAAEALVTHCFNIKEKIKQYRRELPGVPQ